MDKENEKLIKASFRIPKSKLLKLKELSMLRRVSINALAISAIALYLDQEAGIRTDKKADPYILSLSRNLNELKRDSELTSEMLAYYIFHWFCYSQRVDEEQKRGMFLEGTKKFDKFIDLLSKKVRSGGLTLDQINKTPQKDADDSTDDT